MSQNYTEVEAGQLVVLFIDECHLLGNGVCGYVWGKKNFRIEIPFKNIKDRQTFFGALNYQTKEFMVQKYPIGNSASTIEFIKHLRSQYSKQRVALIWDEANYHKSDKLKEFLAAVNDQSERI